MERPCAVEPQDRFCDTGDFGRLRRITEGEARGRVIRGTLAGQKGSDDDAGEQLREIDRPTFQPRRLGLRISPRKSQAMPTRFSA